jgi:hypothetical protein
VDGLTGFRMCASPFYSATEIDTVEKLTARVNSTNVFGSVPGFGCYIGPEETRFFVSNAEIRLKALKTRIDSSFPWHLEDLMISQLFDLLFRAFITGQNISGVPSLHARFTSEPLNCLPSSLYSKRLLQYHTSPQQYHIRFHTSLTTLSICCS